MYKKSHGQKDTTGPRQGTGLQEVASPWNLGSDSLGQQAHKTLYAYVLCAYTSACAQELEAAPALVGWDSALKSHFSRCLRCFPAQMVHLCPEVFYLSAPLEPLYPGSKLAATTWCLYHTRGKGRSPSWPESSTRTAAGWLSRFTSCCINRGAWAHRP